MFINMNNNKKHKHETLQKKKNCFSYSNNKKPKTNSKSFENNPRKRESL